MSSEKHSRVGVIIGGFFLYLMPNLMGILFIIDTFVYPFVKNIPLKWLSDALGICFLVSVAIALVVSGITFKSEMREEDWHKTGEMKYEVKYDSDGKKYNVSGEPVWEDRNHASSHNFWWTIFGTLLVLLFGIVFYITAIVKRKFFPFSD